MFILIDKGRSRNRCRGIQPVAYQFIAGSANPIQIIIPIVTGRWEEDVQGVIAPFSSIFFRSMPRTKVLQKTYQFH